MDIPVDLPKLQQALQNKYQYVVKDITQSVRLTQGYSGAEVWLVEEQKQGEISYAVLKISRNNKTEQDLKKEAEGYERIKTDPDFGRYVPDKMYFFNAEEALVKDNQRSLLYITFVTPNDTEHLDSLGNVILGQSEKADMVLAQIKTFYEQIIKRAKQEQQPSHTAWDHFRRFFANFQKLQNFSEVKPGIEAEPLIAFGNTLRPNLLYFLSNQERHWHAQKFKAPYAWLHGDLNLDNILVLPKQTFAFIDFEKVRETGAFYDLAFLGMWIIQKTVLDASTVEESKYLDLVEQLTKVAREPEDKPQNVSAQFKNCLDLFARLMSGIRPQNERKALLLALTAAALQRSYYEFRDAAANQDTQGQHRRSALFFYAFACTLVEEFISTQEFSKQRPCTLPAFHMEEKQTRETPSSDEKPPSQTPLSDFSHLPLGGYPQSTSSTPYCLRLLYPFSFTGEEFASLYRRVRQQPEDKENPCLWEVVPHVTSTDSFLGTVRLGKQDGLDPYFDRLLYFDQAEAAHEYLLFRLKPRYLQAFKQLKYNPTKKYEINLRLYSLDFLPFRNGVGFMSAAFVCEQGKKPLELRAALDVNYHLPFISGKTWPLVSVKTNEKFDVPTLLAKAKTSLPQSGDCLKECWSEKMELKLEDNTRRLFAMVYTTLAVSDEQWLTPATAEARRFYHQLTRFSENALQHKHDVQSQVTGTSPSFASDGKTPTRTYEFQPHGVTFIGLGSDEFEGNAFLPKFRDSYLFALVLARNIYVLQHQSVTGVAIDAKIGEAAQFLLGCHNAFTQPPRQTFFENSLKFYLGEDYLQRVISVPTTPPVAPPEEKPQYVFRKHGTGWSIVYQGEPIQVEKTLGLNYIWHLLGKPNQNISCQNLYQAYRPADPTALQKRKFVELEETTGTEGRAKRRDKKTAVAAEDDSYWLEKYRTRLKEIEEELEEARDNNDTCRQEKLEEERDRILAECKSLASRFPEKNPEKEKFRKNVCNAIQRAIDAISKENKEFGKFLANAIEKGHDCCYKREDVIWDL